MITIQAFASKIGPRGDTTGAVRAALEHCRRENLHRLVFPKGTYHFFPDDAVEKYLFISNNDEGLKRIAFSIHGFDDLEIDGDGSEFLFHGFILPFVIENSRKVTIKNVTIDWSRTFHSEARVLAVGEGHVDVSISPEFPYAVEHGRLHFIGEGTETYQLRNILEFDGERKETAFLVWDNYGIGDRCIAEAIVPGQLRLHAEFAKPKPIPGNILAMIDTRRDCPAITIASSEGITLDHVTIYHAGAMGVIAQQSRNLSLEGVQIILRPGTERVISTTADATHFVNCAGEINISGCFFENQLDDPVNIHGIYARIESIINFNSIVICLQHIQQLGIDLAAIGERVEFVNAETLLTYHEGVVSGVERLNKERSRITLENPLPPSVRVGDCIGNLTWTPNVTIRGTTSRRNRARGFLISTPGRVLIEDNVFHTPGAALLIAGDANHWFESGAVRDVTIRRNRFENCNYGVWGRATVDIHPEIEQEHRRPDCYHRNITIEANTFVIFDRRILRAESVDGLRITDNTIERSDAYPRQNEAAELFQIEDCRNVTILRNEIAV